jgi:hypothetical protein
MIALDPEVRVADTLGAVNVVTPDNAVLCGKQPNNGGALAVDFVVDSVCNKLMIAT